MAKPATVERDTYTERHIRDERKLRLVKEIEPEQRGTKARPDKATGPESADDVDDMWDNVPV